MARKIWTKAKGTWKVAEGLEGEGFDEEKVKEIVNNSIEVGKISTSDNPGVTITKDNSGKTQINVSFPTYGIIEPNEDFSPDVIGIALTQEGGGTGTWTRFNSNKQVITPDEAYFNNHPVYREIQPQIINNNYMVRIPKFYTKYEYIENKDYWIKWISPTMRDGFHCYKRVA